MEKFTSILRALLTMVTTLLAFGHFTAPIEWVIAILGFVLENADVAYGAIQTLLTILGVAYSLFFDPQRSVNVFQLSTQRWDDRAVGLNVRTKNCCGKEKCER